MPVLRELLDDDETLIYLRLADTLEHDIATGVLPEGARAPSARTLASTLGISPATAVRSYRLLIEHGAVVKRRGVGMFIPDGARQAVLERRTHRIRSAFIEPLLTEAHALGLSTADLIELLKKCAADL